MTWAAPRRRAGRRRRRRGRGSSSPSFSSVTRLRSLRAPARSRRSLAALVAAGTRARERRPGERLPDHAARLPAVRVGRRPPANENSAARAARELEGRRASRCASALIATRATSARCRRSTGSRSATPTSSARSSSTTARARLLVVMPNGYGHLPERQAAEGGQERARASCRRRTRPTATRSPRRPRTRCGRSRSSAASRSRPQAGEKSSSKQPRPRQIARGGVILLCAARARRALCCSARREPRCGAA